MQGRGLAAAWGLLAVLIAGTVAWLALTDGPGDGRDTATPVVTVDLPPFPDPPPEEPVAEEPTASQPEPLSTEPASPELATSPEPEPTASGPEIAATSPGDGAQEPPAEERPLPQPGPESAAEPAPLPSEPDQPDPAVQAAPQTEPPPALEPRAPQEQVAEPAPAVEPEPAEPPEAVQQVTAPPTAPPQPREPRETEPSAERPAGEETEAARAEPEAPGESAPLPPTVEVGAIRPVPGEVLQPLKPPDERPGDPALTEEGPFGPMPAISADGRPAWQAYSRPSPGDEKAGRIAVVIGNLGLADTVTERAINDLPPDITLSFAPYADNVASWVARARAAGHEVLLDLPMEPIDYPKNDPGPKALFTSLGQQQNIERLQWVLSRAAGYVGVTNYMGSRFTTSPEALRPVLEALRDRGLMFLDSRSAARSLATTMASDVNLPRAVNDRFIDVKASRAAIDRRLEELESIAKRDGAAVGIGYPYPVTLDRIEKWAEEIGKRNDLQLAPISAIVGMQADR